MWKYVRRQGVVYKPYACVQGGVGAKIFEYLSVGTIWIAPDVIHDFNESCEILL